MISAFLAKIRSLFANVERTIADLHDYQRMAVEFLIANPFSALFIDLGLGKTCISLTAIMRLVSNFECNHVLVIAPRRVAFETWPTEIGKWEHSAPLSFALVRDDEVIETVNKAGQEARKVCFNHFMKNAVDTLLLNPKEQVEDARERIKDSKQAMAYIRKARIRAAAKAVREQFKRTPATVHIVNREQVEFLVDAWGADWPYDVVIIDESSSFKDHRSNRFKALNRVRPLIKRLHELTATPAAETYLHIFAQIYLLDRGERFGHSYPNFQERYFTQNRYTMKWKLRPGAEEEIAEKIADITLTMKAEDYLSREQPLFLKDKVYLSEDEMDIYKTMERDFIVTLPDGAEVEAETAASLSQKLTQIASGVLYDTVLEPIGKGNFKKKRVVHHVHDAKLDKLKIIVEEACDEPIMVCYWHNSSLDRIKKAFPHAVEMDDDGKCVKKWNAGEIKLLLVHPMSAGHGLNLQYGGRRIVFFDIPWSLELYLQVIGRLDRQGQKLVVIVHHIIAVGTIDEYVLECIDEKDDWQEKLFKLLKKIRKRLNADVTGLAPEGDKS